MSNAGNEARLNRLSTEVEAAVAGGSAARQSAPDDALSTEHTQWIAHVVEACFIHGLRDAFFLKGSRHAKLLEPNLWPFVSKLSHKSVVTQIGRLSQIRSEVGKGRVWLRIALNEGVLVDYLSLFGREPHLLAKFYRDHAYLRSGAHVERLGRVLRDNLGLLALRCATNSSFLNTWTPTPLILAGVIDGNLNDLALRPSTSSSSTPTSTPGKLQRPDDSEEVGVCALDMLYEAEEDEQILARPRAVHNRAASSAGSDGDASSSVYSHPSMVGRPLRVGASNRQVPGAGIVTPPVGSPREERSVLEERQQPRAEPMLRQILDEPLVVRRHVKIRKPRRDRSHSSSGGDEMVLRTPPMEVESSKEEDAEASRSQEEKEQPPVDSGVEEEKQKENGETTADEATPQIAAPPNETTAAADVEPIEEPIEITDVATVDSVDQNGDVETSANVTEDLDPKLDTETSAISEDNVPRLKPSQEIAESDIARIERDAGEEEKEEVVTNGFQAALRRAMQLEDDHSEDEPKVEEIEAKHAEVSTSKEENEDATTTTATTSRCAESRPTVEEDEWEEDEALTEVDQALADELGAERSDIVALWRIPRDRGLDRAKFRCRDCGRAIGGSHGMHYRVCALDATYYCTECFGTELGASTSSFAVPSRLIHNWDPTPRPMSARARRVLDRLADRPLIEISRRNPTLAQHSGKVARVLALRERLHLAAQYLLTCRASVADDLKRRAHPRTYLLTEPSRFSLADLLQTAKVDGGSGASSMERQLSELLQFAVSHVMSCTRCKHKGYVCEMCTGERRGSIAGGGGGAGAGTRTTELIFPFQTDSTHRCGVCFAVFHRRCWMAAAAESCPKCERRAAHALRRELVGEDFGGQAVLPLLH